MEYNIQELVAIKEILKEKKYVLNHDLQKDLLQIGRGNKNADPNKVRETERLLQEAYNSNPIHSKLERVNSLINDIIEKI